ncbi:MAG: hypothetical protein NW205_08910 [Hyphomicrobiaceae bacterium]|nr:hypothetical protein [Hyphomicrobiaceae bacterium]
MKFSGESIFFNAAAGLCAIGGLGYIVSDALTSTKTPSCVSSYPPGYAMAFATRSGVPMTPIELTSYIGSSQQGVMHHAKTAPGDEDSAPTVLSVALESGASHQHQDRFPKGGIAFTWTPPVMKAVTSACLGYSVRFSDDMDFGHGGLLPGLFGGRALPPAETSDGKTGIAARLAWRKNGQGAVLVQAPKANGSTASLLNANEVKFNRGQWHRIEQEVVLNTPGSDDGVLRVWIDGDLAIEQTGLVWRQDASLALSGTAFDVGYGGGDRTWPAPSPATVELTPPELSWQ